MGIFKSEDAKDMAAAGALLMKEEMAPFENQALKLWAGPGRGDSIANFDLQDATH
jgi:hypothetical protein